MAKHEEKRKPGRTRHGWQINVTINVIIIINEIV
jgi:hypothetical protein